uniref:Peptidase S1 domain-containing protein n=1 Tax=Sphaeramia orbicularis TaxID=375764 RepID=A0A672YCM5_9TELE
LLIWAKVSEKVWIIVLGMIMTSIYCFLPTHSLQTDSGGPLVSLTDGLWWLVGDSIWGRSCTEQSKPGVYGNITYFMDWIYHKGYLAPHS